MDEILVIRPELPRNIAKDGEIRNKSMKVDGVGWGPPQVWPSESVAKLSTTSAAPAAVPTTTSAPAKASVKIAAISRKVV